MAAAPQMGDSQLKRSSEERPEAAEPSRMTATVTALKETRKDVYRIWLDNGQVWQQMDLENLFAVKIGDTVQIERGKLGGFRMARGVNSRSGWTRVTRLR